MFFKIPIEDYFEEEVLAIVYYYPEGSTMLAKSAICASSRRLGIIQRTGLFGWEFKPINWLSLESVSLKDGWLKPCSLTIRSTQGQNITLSNLNKKEAKKFAGFANNAIQNHHSPITPLLE